MTRKLTERERTLNVQNRRLTERVAKLEQEIDGYKWDIDRLQDEIRFLRSKVPAEVKYNAFEIINENGNRLKDSHGVELLCKDDVITLAREDCYETYEVDGYPYIDTLDDAIRYFEEHNYTVIKSRIEC